MVLGVAGLTGLLLRKLKQPSILGYLVAGLIVGPYLPVPLFADPERVHSLSEFGVILVMFTVGLEFRLKKFVSVLPVSGVTGLVEMGAMLASGYLLGQALGWYDVRALFLGACICISSTMAVSKILEQRPIPPESKQVVFGILVLQDVAAIALIAVMTAVSKGNKASLPEILGILGKLSAMLFAIVAAGMFFVPRLVRVLERTKSREVLVVGAVGICFSFAVLAQAVGYSTALGAFIGGVLVAESGLGHQIEMKTASLRDVFVAIFFVSIGMSVDPLVAWKTLPTSLLVLGVVVVTQFVSVSLAGIATGMGVGKSVTAGSPSGK
jgi:CPA2 family monovalent cation:H+ antiporter-2